VELYQGEAAGTNWAGMSMSSLAEGIVANSTKPVTVIAVDGRSGGGKTTLASALTLELKGTLLSTDDFAWWHSFFDWPAMLIENAIAPLLQGQPVDYRPDAWIERHREGSIRAEPSSFIILEGVGALQSTLRPYVDVGIWVQSDASESKRRGLARDLAQRPDPAEAERFWDEWQSAENEFQSAQQSWKVADWWICATPSQLDLKHTGEGLLAATKNSKSPS